MNYATILKAGKGNDCHNPAGSPNSTGGQFCSSTSASIATSRTRPKEQVIFEKPLEGPNGVKLVSYVWQYDYDTFIDSRGEEQTKRVSNWDESVPSAITNRQIVHQFGIERNGVAELVSAETAAKLLTGGDAEIKAKFKSVASAAKTLAKQRMKLMALQAEAQQMEVVRAQVDKLPDPKITARMRAEGDPSYIPQGSVIIEANGERVTFKHPMRAVSDEDRLKHVLDWSTVEDAKFLWREDQYTTQGAPSHKYGKVKADLSYAERDVKRTEKKIKGLTK